MHEFNIFAFLNPHYLGFNGLKKFPEGFGTEAAVAIVCRGATRVRFEANAHVMDLD